MFRLLELNQYLNDRVLKQLSDAYHDRQLELICQDPKGRIDYQQNRTRIEAKILSANILKTLKIIFYTILIVYFVGTYLFVLSLASFTFVHGADAEEESAQSISNSHAMQLIGLTAGRRQLINFYFALTTLSTVGFGDFYPKTDIERVIGIFVIFLGVAIFAYIIGEFLTMVTRIKDFIEDPFDDDNLEGFFGMLQSYNGGRVID